MKRRTFRLADRGSMPQGSPRAGGDATGNAPAGAPCQGWRGITTHTLRSALSLFAGMLRESALTYRRAMLVLPREAPWFSDRTTCGAAIKHRRVGLWTVFRQESHNTGASCGDALSASSGVERGAKSRSVDRVTGPQNPPIWAAPRTNRGCAEKYAHYQPIKAVCGYVFRATRPSPLKNTTEI